MAKSKSNTATNKQAQIQGDVLPRLLRKTRTKGEAGLRILGGYVRDEFLTRLQGREGVAVYREMSENDPIIGGTLTQIQLAARPVKWTPKAGLVSSPSDARAIALLTRALSEVRSDWSGFINDALSMLTFGWALFEVTYKPSPDGLVLWDKFQFRAQDTLFKWSVDDNYNPIGMIQYIPWLGYQPVIPFSDYVLHFRTTTKKNNPEGQSLLRRVYRPWYFRKLIEEFEAIGIERNLVGLPIINITDPNIRLLDPDNIDLRTWLENTVTNLHKDEQAGVVLPYGFSLDLLAIKGREAGGLNIEEVINRYSKEIATGLVAQFINMAFQAKGSLNAIKFYNTQFLQAIDTWISIIADEINGASGVKKLLWWNGLADSHVYLEPAKITPEDLASLASYVSRLLKLGGISADPNLEANLRERAGLPPIQSIPTQDQTKKF